jgi:2-keto-3-deoxy-L-rhamnonate aldolase RhmA
MQPNRFKQVLAEGRIPIGHMIAEFGTRGMARMCELAGLDFVVVDTEHTGFSPTEIADLMTWFKATPVTPFVRVPQIVYHLIARTLDCGALGIMAPNVQSAAEARALVDAVKYAPLGRRGLITGNANSDFLTVDVAEFTAASNANTSVICQIESQEGLDNLESIAATPGVDVLWVGHGDLCLSLGIAGQFKHPRFLEALRLVAETARKHGLAAGIQPQNLDQAREWMELGYNVISYGMDQRVYLTALSQGVAAVRKLS